MGSPGKCSDDISDIRMNGGMARLIEGIAEGGELATRRKGIVEEKIEKFKVGSMSGEGSYRVTAMTEDSCFTLNLCDGGLAGERIR